MQALVRKPLYVSTVLALYAEPVRLNVDQNPLRKQKTDLPDLRNVT